MRQVLGSVVAAFVVSAILTWALAEVAQRHRR